MSTMNPAEYRVFTERVAEHQARYEAEIAALRADIARSTASVERLTIANVLRDTAIKHGVRTAAVDDVLLRAGPVFKLQDGKPVPMDGDTPLKGEGDGPMTPAEWMEGLSKTAPHLFDLTVLQAHAVANENRAKQDFLSNPDAIAAGKVKPPRLNTEYPRLVPRPSDAEFLDRVEAIAAGPAEGS